RSEQVRKWLRRHPRLASSGTVAAAAGVLLLAGGSLLLGARAQLTAAQGRAYEAEGAEARPRRPGVEQGALRGPCPGDSHSERQEHVGQGRAVCEQTLALYGVQDDPDWQKHPAWQRLSPEEQRRVAEDARELLLLLAGAQVRLAPTEDRTAPREALALLERAE